MQVPDLHVISMAMLAWSEVMEPTGCGGGAEGARGGWRGTWHRTGECSWSVRLGGQSWGIYGKLNSLAGQAVQAVGGTFWLDMIITDVRDLSFFLHDLQYPIHHSEQLLHCT